MLSPVYIYRAALKRVIDGDTFELVVDLGFKVGVTVTIRLRNFYAPETGTVDGTVATNRAVAAFAAARTIILQTTKTRTGSDVQTFARYVADIWLDGVSLAETLASKDGSELIAR